MVGALLSGAEPRLRTFVLSAADAGPVAHMQSGAVRPPEYATLAAATRARWSAALAPFDVRRLVGRAAGAPILFQHGRRDDTVPPENAARVHAAVATPHQVRWYDAGHRLPPQGYVDQLAWLARWVGMAPVTPADAAGPAFPARAPGMLPEERGTRRREMIEREQGATERQEGDMEVCALLVAPGEPARRVEVRECALHRALHHPAVASEAGTRGDARPHSFGDYRRRRNERTCPRATRHLGRGSESSRRGLDARQIA
jgi:hypothetical protein